MSLVNEARLPAARRRRPRCGMTWARVPRHGILLGAAQARWQKRAMHEIELKFQVPAAQRVAVRRAVATASASTIRLQALYVDTPDRRLAAAGLALRLRKEGACWVQTLKGPGDGLMHRLEHEVVLPRSRTVPTIDLALHAGSALGSLLARALGDSGSMLGVVFSTDIRRTQRSIRLVGGTVVELAFDEGEIRAGDARLAVCELAFELNRGTPSAVPALASRWVARHGLWLDVRSKAERGERLARGLSTSAAAKFSPPALHPAMSGDQALRAMLGAALNQVLANASELAGNGGSVEHLHQCRVGLRRLRCVLRDFAALAGEPVPADFADWSERLAQLFDRLGSARDQDAMCETLLPALQAAGAPHFEFLPESAGSEEPGAMLREAGCNRLWLDMLVWLNAPPLQEGVASAPPLVATARATLRRLQRQVATRGARFASLDEVAQHRVRKRLKRLRYGLDACAALFARKAMQRRLAVLSPAQDALGNYNNLLVARALFESRLAGHPQAWFALGWLAAQREGAVRACVKSLARVARLPRL